MALIANEVDFAMMSAFLMIPVSVQNRDVTMLGGFSRYAQRNPADSLIRIRSLKSTAAGISTGSMPRKKPKANKQALVQSAARWYLFCR